MEMENRPDYPYGTCTWSCTAGTPGCCSCARTRSSGGSPVSRRRRRRRRRLPLPWYPRRRRRSCTPARRRASPSVLIHQERFSLSIPRSPPPAQMPPRNETALGTHPRGRRRSAQGRRGGGEEADGHVPAPRRLAFSNPLARREKEPDGLLCLYLSRAFFAGGDDIVAGGETPLLGGAVPGRRGDGDNRRRRKRRLGWWGGDGEQRWHPWVEGAGGPTCRRRCF
jgi:hypothetical protein